MAQSLTDQSGKSINSIVPQTTESQFNPPVDVAEIKASLNDLNVKYAHIRDTILQYDLMRSFP